MLVPDDRAVRDSERKAALMHFSSEQATQMTEHPPTVVDADKKPSEARTEHVKSLAKPAHGERISHVLARFRKDVENI